MRRICIALLLAASVACGQDWHMLGALWTEPGAAAAPQYALTFNGTNQYGYVANNANHDIGVTNLTVSFWIKTTAASGSTKGIVGKTRYAAESGRWYVWNDNSYLRARLISTAEPTYAWTNINNGAWRLIVSVLDRTATTGTTTLYVDGVSVASVASTIGYSDNLTNSDMTMVAAYPSSSGGVPPTSASYLAASIDDVAIWHRALSSNEVSDIWHSGNGRRITATGTFPSSGVSMGTGLASVYAFDEGTGATAGDPINSVNLTLTNSPTWTTGKQFP